MAPPCATGLAPSSDWSRHRDERTDSYRARVDPYDNPFWHSLRGPLSDLAEGDEHAARFQPDVNVFAALPDEPDERSWKSLAHLVGPGGTAVLCRSEVVVPDGWTPGRPVPSVQFVAPPGIARPASDVVELTEADAAEMLALATDTDPGPFRQRTIEQGGFIGFRERGELVAMGGTRCRVPGGVEISSLCTAPHARGRGLAEQLFRELVVRIESTGDRAFLHTAQHNEAAIRLYRRLGLTLRARQSFFSVTAP